MKQSRTPTCALSDEVGGMPSGSTYGIGHSQKAACRAPLPVCSSYNEASALQPCRGTEPGSESVVLYSVKHTLAPRLETRRVFKWHRESKGRVCLRSFQFILVIIQRSCSGFVVPRDRPTRTGKACAMACPGRVYHSLWVRFCEINESQASVSGSVVDVSLQHV